MHSFNGDLESLGQQIKLKQSVFKKVEKRERYNKICIFLWTYIYVQTLTNIYIYIRRYICAYYFMCMWVAKK